MTYEQWIRIEGWARCSRLQEHGIALFPLSDEERDWLAQYGEFRNVRTWRGFVAKYVAASLLVTTELARRTTLMAPQELA